MAEDVILAAKAQDVYAVVDVTKNLIANPIPATFGAATLNYRMSSIQLAITFTFDTTVISPPTLNRAIVLPDMTKEEAMLILNNFNFIFNNKASMMPSS